MKKQITILITILTIGLSSTVIASANAITSYYKYNGKVTSYSEAFKLVQKKNKDQSKSSYYKPVQHSKNQFTLLYYRDGKKKDPVEFRVRTYDHNKKVEVTNIDKLYQLSYKQHGKITNGK